MAQKFATHTTTKMDIEHARQLRRDMTKPERIVWKQLRELPPELGLTFRRQHPVHPYILDFACIKIKLAVEIDGMSHDDVVSQHADNTRTEFLMEQGYDVLRFTNADVLNRDKDVVLMIISKCHERLDSLK